MFIVYDTHNDSKATIHTDYITTSFFLTNKMLNRIIIALTVNYIHTVINIFLVMTECDI